MAERVARKYQAAAKDFTPEKRRKPKPGEYEVMKGRLDRQKWFYVKSLEDAKLLVQLGRNYGFPTGITKGPHGYPSEFGIDE
jgi:hypothetical protein